MTNEMDADADPWTDINLDDPELQKLLDEPLKLNKSLLRADEHFIGFDNNVGDTWIYPSNMPLRSYQFNITQSAMYRNTLVVLPTGLGKTFIAAVVMYNLYRWYPTGKVIFMAPTRPLVAQQIEACQKIMPFPNEDTVELTGRLNKKTRTELWRSKRVFFATPQVVQSDIISSEQGDSEVSFPFDRVKLVVVDEAHKAKGRYAYTDVIQSIWQRNRYFRVLALTATPGRTVDDVAQVIRNLFISHLETRCDTSVDVCSYVHKRKMSTVVVSLSEEMTAIRDELLDIVDPYLRQLIEADVLSGSLTNISRNWLLYEQKRFRERSMHQRHPKQSAVSTNFSVCISLYHALDLLERHGTRVFLNNFDQDDEGRTKFVVSMDRRLRNLIERVRREVGPNPFDVSANAMTNGEIAEIPADLDFGHPKFEKTRSCLLEHFEKNPESRAIVFCEYRESVMLVYRLLLQHRPLLKPRCFVGQGGSTGFLRALTQKQQIQIMSDFRSGANNILIATCIGEEGIDVGEVDLIVCFDISTSNPTRFVQRIGRTGRQKQGTVVMLVTAGKEQAQLKEVLATKDQLNKKLLNSSVISAAVYKHSPRMVPTEFNPQCLKAYIKPPQPQAEPSSKRDKKSASNKIKTSGSQDLRKFFKNTKTAAKVTALDPVLDDEDLEIFADDRNVRNPSQPAGVSTQISIEKSLSKLNNYFKDLDFSNIAPPTTQTQVQAIEAVAEHEAVICLSDSESRLPTRPANIEIDEKWWRKFNKIVESECAASKEKTAPVTQKELLQKLKSPDITRVTKRIMLIMNVDFVRRICEQMKALQAVDGDNEEEESDEADNEEEDEGFLIDDENQETRDNYELLLDIYEGKEALAKFLDEMELKEFKRNCKISDEVLLADDDDSEEFMKKLDDVFKDADELGFCNDNWDYINEEYNKTHYYKRQMAANDSTNKANGTVAESMVFETMHQSSECFSTQIDDMFHDMENEDFHFVESKYCSQWEELQRPANEPYNSTPVQRSKTVKRSEDIKDIIQESMRSETKKLNATKDIDSKNSESFNESPKNRSQWDEFLNVGNQKNSTPLQEPTTRHSEPHRTSRNIFSICEESHRELAVAAEGVEQLSPIEAIAISHKPGDSPTQGNESTPENLDLSAATIVSEDNSIKTSPTKESSKHHLDLDTQSVNAMLEDIDFDAFLEPFPEESFSAAVAEAKPSTNLSNGANISPDVFVNDSNLLKLGAIQTNFATAQKQAAYKSTSNTKQAITPGTPTKPLRSHEALGKCTQKSPSIYDMYMKNMQRLISQRKKSLSVESKANKSVKSEDDETLIVRRRNPVAKRKIIESDSEDEERSNQEEDGEKSNQIEKRNYETDNTSSDEIQASQRKKQVPQRCKRRRLLCAFIQDEAGVSGSELSADEAENTFANQAYDSIVVSDGSEDDLPNTQMHAMYMQSVKSPSNRRGAFKIPAFKVYNDQDQIYSQAVPVEKSQYVADSFVVSEDDVAEVEDVSICPLERAERILKEKRRARRRYAQIAKVNNEVPKQRKRVKWSDEDFD